jgi:hydrogenase maturation protease
MTGAEMEDSDAVLLRTFASTHTILRVSGAEFLSLTDPPPDHALAATRCENVGTWPVLVGDEKARARDTMLSSPIILYDYPRIAPESAGDLCDGLEIDEILTLRVMTMTDDEKNEMRNVDACARRILERTDSLRGDDLLKMHGVMRDVSFPEADFFGEHTRLDHVSVGGVALQAGDRVRISPKSRADAMDMMLAGKIGLIEAIEQDAEANVHLAIVLEEDPGRDLGMMRQPGHRFFYRLDEVEPLREGES